MSWAIQPIMLLITIDRFVTPTLTKVMSSTKSPIISKRKLSSMKGTHISERPLSSLQLLEHLTKVQISLASRTQKLAQYSQVVLVKKRESDKGSTTPTRAASSVTVNHPAQQHAINEPSRVMFSEKLLKTLLTAKNSEVKVVALQIYSENTNPPLNAAHTTVWSRPPQRLSLQSFRQRLPMSTKLRNFTEIAPRSMAAKSLKAHWWQTELTGKTRNSKHSTILIRRRMENISTALKLRSTNSFKAVSSEVVTWKERQWSSIVRLPKLALEALLIGKLKVVWPNPSTLDLREVQTRTCRSKSS